MKTATVFFASPAPASLFADFFGASVKDAIGEEVKFYPVGGFDVEVVIAEVPASRVEFLQEYFGESEVYVATSISEIVKNN